MRISDWSSDVCSSDLQARRVDVGIRIAAGIEVAGVECGIDAGRPGSELVLRADLPGRLLVDLGRRFGDHHVGAADREAAEADIEAGVEAGEVVGIIDARTKDAAGTDQDVEALELGSIIAATRTRKNTATGTNLTRQF